MSENSVLFVYDPNASSEQINLYHTFCENLFNCQHAGTSSLGREMADSNEFDIVVSSMNLPDSTGAEFQKYIYDNHKGMVRIIYSEKPDKELIYKSSEYVHQFLSDPCKQEQFVSILKNSIGLRTILTDKSVHDKIAGITSLPTPPEIYNNLMQELQKDEISIRNVAELIKKDVSITAKLLHIVNSAFFGLSTHVESPLHAVNLLGIDTVKSLVMTAGVFNQFDESKIPGYSIDTVYNNSLAVGTSARHLANSFGLLTKHTEDALMAGMLHDIGKLIMISYFPEELKKSIELSKASQIPLHEAQKQVIGVTDAVLGAHLLSLWGLPNPILEAIALHYNPAETIAPMTNVTTAVHLAYALHFDISNNIKDDSLSAVDKKYLQNLGIDTSIENLKQFCMAAV